MTSCSKMAVSKLYECALLALKVPVRLMAAMTTFNAVICTAAEQQEKKKRKAKRWKRVEGDGTKS